MDAREFETCVAPLTLQEFDAQTKVILLSASIAPKAASRQYIQFCLEVYDVWCAVVNRRSTLADGILSQCVRNLIEWYWFARNAKQIAEYLDWILSKFPDAGDVIKPTREEQLLAYLKGEASFARGSQPFSTHVKAANFSERFGQLVSVVVLANSLMSVHLKEPVAVVDPFLVRHLQLTMGVDDAALTNLRESERSKSTMIENWWWYEQCVNVDRRPERQKCKWMYHINKFLTEEYVALLDGVCYGFGVATTIELSGDRAAWWKVKREDALATANFVRSMKAEDKRALSRTGGAEHGNGLAYRIPVRIGREGFYACAAERELDLCRLFHKITNHIRKGRRIVAWLTDKLERVTAALRSRVFIGGEAIKMTKLDLRELHECVIGSTTGVYAARCCTVRAPEAKCVLSHTQSESFAGMVQCLCALLDKWDSKDVDLNRAYERVREYCDTLCKLGVSDDEDPLCATGCQSQRSDCRRVGDLDSFLDTLVQSDQLQWVCPNHEQPIATVATELSISQAARTEFDERYVKLVTSMYPMTSASRSDHVVHGVYHERNLVQPARALPPASHRIRDRLHINACEWTLPLKTITPVHLPRGLDRLCRRRYRPLPITLSSNTAAEALIQRYVHEHSCERDRQGGLEALCERVTERARAPHEYFANAYWETEMRCMREERSLSLRTNTLGDHTGLMEFTFWLREFLTANRRWVRQSNIRPSESPQSHDSVVDAHRAEVFVVFPDEFRIAFKCSDAGVSNCVLLPPKKCASERYFLHYCLEADCRVDAHELMRSMRSEHPAWEWFYHVDALGGKHFRIRKARDVDLIALVGADNVSACFLESEALDVRQPEFVPGAVLFTDSLGRFARFVFWGLVQSMAADEDKAWSALVPRDALHNLPVSWDVTSGSTMDDGDDTRPVSAADPCWREYLFWVTIELQRIILLMKPCNMGPRISGSGLQIMSTDRVYNGHSVASILFGVHHSKKERTKKVVRPNSYLNSRCVSILANAGCVYFPFHSRTVLSLCQDRLGFVRSPGYDSKRYPYVWKVVVDSKGDLRDDVPICFGSPLIGRERFSDFVQRLSSCAGYSRVEPSEGSVDAELKLARIVNTYGYSRMGISFSTNGSRKRANSSADPPREIAKFTSAEDRMEFTATSVSKVAFSNDIMLSRRTDDRHSTQSVGVAHAHCARRQVAQLGDRYMFCDVQEDGAMMYRVCIGDTLRRVCMGFPEQSVTFWQDLCDDQLAGRTHPPVYPDLSYSSEVWLKTLRTLASSCLNNLRHLIVPDDDTESTANLKSELRGMGWTASNVDYERGSCTIWAKADEHVQSPNDLFVVALRSIHRWRTEDVAHDHELTTSVFSLLVRFQTSSVRDYLKSIRECRMDILSSFEASRSVTMSAISEFAVRSRLALEKAIKSLQRMSCGRSARLLELFGLLISAMDTGRTNASAIIRSPRAVSRWIKLTGNVCLLTRSCLRVQSISPSVPDKDDLRSAFELINRVMDMCDNIVTNLSCSISDACEVVCVRELSSLFDASEELVIEDEHIKCWSLCSSRCLSHLSMFYLHEDLLYGGQLPVEDAPFEHAEDAFGFEGGVTRRQDASDSASIVDEENMKKIRCSRQQIREIMNDCDGSKSTDAISKDLKLLHASDSASRHVWTDVVNECILLADLSRRSAEDKVSVHDDSEHACDSEEADSETSREASMRDLSGDEGVTVNDICFGSVCRSLHAKDFESRVRRSDQLYRIDFAIRTLGQAAETWSVCRDAVEMRTPETQSGFFHMYEVRIPDTLHEDLEKQWVRCDSAEQRKVIVEVAVQKEQQVVHSTRIKPFRFLLDEVLTQHVDMRSMADNFGCVHFPSMTRCDLITNEKRTIRHKDGAAGVLLSFQGRVCAFRFMASALILNRDVDMLDV
eukprot:gene99-146_t